ncbi:P-loop containing nucleoside triphosphate hydrolase protein [Auriculariales sp. MPI-PUGE-AT-0066]|nr:P-loop containing nucleoside triphosphate hydrolase protein [Auriculariales sp. MPI-PUGE-AT-0066]
MSFPAALLPAAPSWYPGHMHSFNKMLPSLLARTDIVLELRDTRMPLTSINPTFESTVARWRADRRMKPGSCCERLIVYGKQDLVGRWGVKPFHRAMQHLHPHEKFIFASGHDPKAMKKLHGLLVNVAKKHVHSHTELNVTIIGMPNVGKSTLLNGLRSAGMPGPQPKALRTSALPGMTRALSTRLKLYIGNVKSKAWDKSKGEPEASIDEADDLADKGCPIYAFDTPGLMLPFLGNGFQGAERGIKLGLIVKEGMYDYDFLATYLIHRFNFLQPESPAYLELLAPKSHSTSKDPQRIQHVLDKLDLAPGTQLDAEEFLRLLAERRGMTLKGGRVDIGRAAQWLVEWWRERGGAVVGGRTRRGWGFDFEFTDDDGAEEEPHVVVKGHEDDLFRAELDLAERSPRGVAQSDVEAEIQYHPYEDLPSVEDNQPATHHQARSATLEEIDLSEEDEIQLRMESIISRHFSAIAEETRSGGRISATREKNVARAEATAKRKAKVLEKLAKQS